MRGIAKKKIIRIGAQAKAVEVSDYLVEEQPLEIRVRGESVAITMRTPGMDRELVMGFLITEGIVKSPNEVIDIAHCKKAPPESAGNIVNVFLDPSVEFELEHLTRHVFATSSCGICGKASIEAIQRIFPPIKVRDKIKRDIVTQLPEILRDQQLSFQKTGGLHAAGIFDFSGELRFVAEDVGRHNAVDKCLGQGFFKDGLSFEKTILMLSGRASFEIMQKAIAARIPIVSAVSAPSSLAVESAEENGQTLIGFLRGKSFNIYSHADRIAGI